MGYHAFKDDEGETFGSFETFYMDRKAAAEWSTDSTENYAGFYWWPCFPGCIPDGEPSGPFETESAAIEDAQGQG
jgi:hypothetical protein